jgi:hypothetical protein
MSDDKTVKISQYLLNLGLSLKSMKRILTYYETVYLSSGQMSHGVRLVSHKKRDGGKLPSFLASVSLKVIVLSSDL